MNKICGSSDIIMKLIVGLGNPGKKYEGTRHNVGFMVLDELAQIVDTKFVPNKKFESEMAELNIGSEKVILAKPTTFMNLSGNAVSSIRSFYKIDITDIWVVCDDYDLPLGTLRTRSDFQTSTHKGVGSITSDLGSSDFKMIRLGIYQDSKIGIDDFVLAKFEDRDQPILSQIIEKTADLTVEFIKDGFKSHTIDLSE